MAAEETISIDVRHLQVRDALVPIGEHFGVSPPLSLYLLYLGVEIAESSVLQDVFPSDRIEQVWLHRRDPSVQRRQGSTIIDLKKRYYGYCKTCKACTVARPIFMHCRDEDGKFRLKRPETVDLHMDDIPPDYLVGECLVCKDVDVTATVTYTCAEEGSKVAVLKSVRWNGAKMVPCMMCEQVKDRIFVFSCSSRHTLCLDCFSRYCQVMLGSDKFSTFGDSGFSVCCPGPDESCSFTPVEDQHHFKMVDKGGAFYDKFIAESAKPSNLVPQGNNIMCVGCMKEIHLSSEANAARATPAPQVQGAGFSLRLTKIVTRPVTASMVARSKVTCPSCRAGYCANCKKAWHEGVCPDPPPQERPHIRFKISSAMAAKSCWHGN